MFIIEIFCIYIVVFLKIRLRFLKPCFKAINPLLGKIIPALCPWRNGGKKTSWGCSGSFFVVVLFPFLQKERLICISGDGSPLLTSNLLVLLSWDLKKSNILSLKGIFSICRPQSWGCFPRFQSSF